jgi:septum site-determining protein MinD
MTRIIGIMAGKGGVGKTTVVVNLACALGLLNKRVGLMDLNFTTSHLALEFGIVPQITLNNVLKNEARIENAIYPCFNVFLIPASMNLYELQDIDVSGLGGKIKESLGTFDIVLLDGAPGFGREALATLQASDELILVANPTVASIADAMKCRQMADKLGKPVIGVIVNKYRGKDFELKPEEIAKLLELPLLAIIREDDMFPKAEASKTPLVFFKRGKAEEFVRLASSLAGVEYNKPGFFDRLFSNFL